MSNPLSIIELTPASIPSPSSSSEEYQQFKSTILTNSTSLIKSLPSSDWKTGKIYNKKDKLPTRSYRIRNPVGGGETEGFKWHARVSNHPIEQFEGFQAGLLSNHSIQEQKYIESCSSANLIESYEEGVLEVWQMSYDLPFPTSNRDFVVLIYTIDTTPLPTESIPTPLRSFQVVSIPFSHPSAPVGASVRGKYVSVEEVSEVETIEGGKNEVVWKMTTASNAKGNVPKKITEMAMPSKISEDVPSFVEYLSKSSK